MVTTRKRKKGEDSDFSDFDSPRPKKSIPIRGGKLTKKQKKAEEEGKEEKRQEVLEAMQLAKGRFQRLKLKVHTHDEKIDLIENSSRVNLEKDEEDTKIVTLVVNGENFLIYRKLISWYSPVLNLIFKDSIDIYEVLNTTDDAMVLIWRYLHTGNIWNEYGTYDCSTEIYFEIALLANQLFIAEIQNLALEAIRKVTVNMNRIDVNIDMLYEQTCPGSVIRSFLVNLFAAHIEPMEMNKTSKAQIIEGETGYPEEFLGDLLAAYRKRQGRVTGVDDFNIEEYCVNRLVGVTDLNMLPERW